MHDTVFSHDETSRRSTVCVHVFLHKPCFIHPADTHAVSGHYSRVSLLYDDCVVRYHAIPMIYCIMLMDDALVYLRYNHFLCSTRCEQQRHQSYCHQCYDYLVVDSPWINLLLHSAVPPTLYVSPVRQGLCCYNISIAGTEPVPLPPGDLS